MSKKRVEQSPHIWGVVSALGIMVVILAVAVACTRGSAPQETVTINSKIDGVAVLEHSDGYVMKSINGPGRTYVYEFLHNCVAARKTLIAENSALEELNLLSQCEYVHIRTLPPSENGRVIRYLPNGMVIEFNTGIQVETFPSR